MKPTATLDPRLLQNTSNIQLYIHHVCERSGNLTWRPDFHGRCPSLSWPLQPVFGTFSAQLRGTAWRRGVAAEPARSCQWPQSRHRLRTDHEQMLTFGQPSYFPPHQDNDKLECAFAPHQAKEAKHKLEANGPKHRPNSCLKTNAFSVASWDCWIAAFQDISNTCLTCLTCHRGSHA